MAHNRASAAGFAVRTSKTPELCAVIFFRLAVAIFNFAWFWLKSTCSFPPYLAGRMALNQRAWGYFKSFGQSESLLCERMVWYRISFGKQGRFLLFFAVVYMAGANFSRGLWGLRRGRRRGRVFAPPIPGVSASDAGGAGGCEIPGGAVVDGRGILILRENVIQGCFAFPPGWCVGFAVVWWMGAESLYLRRGGDGEFHLGGGGAVGWCVCEILIFVGGDWGLWGGKIPAP